MNKLTSTENNSISLSFGLIAVIFTVFSLFFIVGIEAESYYERDNYKTQYPSYANDANYYKSKDSTTIKKINCINTNINIDGNSNGDINTFAKSLGNDLGTGTSADAEDEIEDDRSYSNSFENNERYDDGYDNGHEKDKDFDCIIDNDNNNRGSGSGNPTTPTPPTLACETCFQAILTEEEINDLVQIIRNSNNSLEGLCNFIEITIENPENLPEISSLLAIAGGPGGVGISVDKLNLILECLGKVYGVDFPPIP